MGISAKSEWQQPQTALPTSRVLVSGVGTVKPGVVTGHAYEFDVFNSAAGAPLAVSTFRYNETITGLTVTQSVEAGVKIPDVGSDYRIFAQLIIRYSSTTTDGYSVRLLQNKVAGVPDAGGLIFWEVIRYVTGVVTVLATGTIAGTFFGQAVGLRLFVDDINGADCHVVFQTSLNGSTWLTEYNFIDVGSALFGAVGGRPYAFAGFFDDSLTTRVAGQKVLIDNLIFSDDVPPVAPPTGAIFRDEFVSETAPADIFITAHVADENTGGNPYGFVGTEAKIRAVTEALGGFATPSGVLQNANVNIGVLTSFVIDATGVLGNFGTIVGRSGRVVIGLFTNTACTDGIEFEILYESTLDPAPETRTVTIREYAAGVPTPLDSDVVSIPNGVNQFEGWQMSFNGVTFAVTFVAPIPGPITVTTLSAPTTFGSYGPILRFGNEEVNSMQTDLRRIEVNS